MLTLLSSFLTFYVFTVIPKEVNPVELTLLRKLRKKTITKDDLRY